VVRIPGVASRLFADGDIELFGDLPRPAGNALASSATGRRAARALRPRNAGANEPCEKLKDDHCNDNPYYYGVGIFSSK